MENLSLIFIIAIICFISIIRADNNAKLNLNNKYYIISIKNASKYSFDIQPTKQDESVLRRRGEIPKFNEINIKEIHEIINSKDCASQLYNNNDTETSLCNLGNSKESFNKTKSENKVIDSINFEKIEKELEPEESFVNEQFEMLAELIIENLDTYKKDDLVTEEIHSLVRKRSKTTINDIISDIGFEKILKKAYNILDVTVFFGYLSDVVYEIVKNLPNVVECIENFKVQFPVVPEKFNYNSEKQSKKDGEKIIENKNENEIYYNITDIKADTQWSDVSIEPNAGSHLSLISQSKVDFNLVNKYDSNFYYPSTAGEGVDIYFIDSGINTNHVDFDTTYRNVTCDAETKGLSYIEYEPSSPKIKNCTIDEVNQYHGISVTSAAAGTINGVAKKANIHVIAIDLFVSDFISALKFIENKAKNPHKTIINISCGMYKYSSTFDKQINVMINKGFMIFSTAGNESTDACSTEKREAADETVNDKHYPSGYIDVISVGGINNDDEDHEFDKNSNIYSPAWFSNYGSCIDFYAPSYAYLATISGEQTDEKEKGVVYQKGTSFSSPIVAGIAATLISEHPNITFNQSIMKQMLLDLSIEGVISDLDDLDTPNRLINIGKQVVYSSDNEYKGCGIPSGKRSCPADSCCSSQGYCGTDVEFCEIDCQSEFGQCSVNNHPAPEKPKKESEYRDIVILNYYNELEMCVKFVPSNDLYDNVIMTICEGMNIYNINNIWQTAKKGDTKIIENFYEDTCILLDEDGVVYADGCENGAVFKDIVTVHNKDAIQSDAFPGKCLKPVVSDYNPYGLTIFTERNGIRVMMDDCDYTDDSQHWRFREVPEPFDDFYFDDDNKGDSNTDVYFINDNYSDNDSDDEYDEYEKYEYPSETDTAEEEETACNDEEADSNDEEADSNDEEADSNDEEADSNDEEADSNDEEDTFYDKEDTIIDVPTEGVDIHDEEDTIVSAPTEEEEDIIYNEHTIVSEPTEEVTIYNDEEDTIANEPTEEETTFVGVPEEEEEEAITNTPEEEEVLYDKYDQIVDLNEYIEYNIFVRPFITSTKKVWIYNEELNLCVTSHSRYKQQVRLDECEEDNYAQLWYVPDNYKGYYINVEDDDISIIYTPMKKLTFDGNLEVLKLSRRYIKNHSSVITYEDDLLKIYDKFHDEEVCFNIDEKEKSKKSNVLVDMVPCNETTTRWKLTTEFPLA